MLIDAEWVALHTSLLAGYLDTMQEEVTSETYASYKSDTLKEFDVLQHNLKARENSLHNQNFSNESSHKKRRIIQMDHGNIKHLYHIANLVYAKFTKLIEYLDKKGSEVTQSDEQDKQFFKDNFQSINPTILYPSMIAQHEALKKTLGPASSDPIWSDSYTTFSRQRQPNPDDQKKKNTGDFRERLDSAFGDIATFKEQLSQFGKNIDEHVIHMKKQSASIKEAIDTANDNEKTCILLENQTRKIHAEFLSLRTNIPMNMTDEEKEQLQIDLDKNLQEYEPTAVLKKINELLQPLDFIYDFLEQAVVLKIQEFKNAADDFKSTVDRLAAQSIQSIFSLSDRDAMSNEVKQKQSLLSIQHMQLEYQYNVFSNFIDRHPRTMTDANTTKLLQFSETVNMREYNIFCKNCENEFRNFLRKLPALPQQVSEEKALLEYKKTVEEYLTDFKKKSEVFNSVYYRFANHDVHKIVNDLRRSEVPVVKATSDMLTCLDHGLELYKKAPPDPSKDSNYMREDIEELEDIRHDVQTRPDTYQLFQAMYKRETLNEQQTSTPPTHTKQTPPPGRFASRVAVFASTLSALAFPPVPTDLWNASDTAKKPQHAKHAKHTLGHSPFLRILCKHVAHIASVAHKHEALAAHRFLLEVTSTSPIVASAIAHAPLTKLEHPNIHALRAHLRDSTLRPLHVIAETVIQDTIATTDLQDTIAETAMHPLPTYPQPTTTTTTRRDATREEYIYF